MLCEGISRRGETVRKDKVCAGLYLRLEDLN